MRTEPDLDAVGEAMREVAARVILPRFRLLTEGEVSEKGPGDLVTVADVEAEQELTRFLAERWPGSTVIGEEAVAADPSILAAARSQDRVWVIDPIDGTANFVAGSEEFAVMVALVEQGVTVASWILHPVSDRLYTAVRGGGAAVDGRALVRAPAPTDPGELRAVVTTRLLAHDVQDRVAARAQAFGHLEPSRGAAGIQYPRLAEGEVDVILYWRTLVWDHAPGTLLVEEAGCRVTRLDGTDYQPWSEGDGLLLAADPATNAGALLLLAPDGQL